MSLLERIIHAIERAIEGPMTEDEVTRALDALAAKHPEENYKWKTSIVDLLKLLELPSGMSDRAKMADELGMEGMTAFSGSPEDNGRLHELVMKKVADRCITIPKA